MPAPDARPPPGVPAGPSRRAALYGLAFGAVAGLTACTGARGVGVGGSHGASAPVVASPTGTGEDGILDVTSYGAVGDGRTDDSDAITAAIAAARAGQTIKFPAHGVFCHDRVLTLSTADVTVIGPGTLRATAEQTSAFKIEADGVRVRDLTLSITATTRRWSAPDQHKLYLGAFHDIEVSGVVVTGSAAAGVFCDGPSRFRLDRVTVSDTRADGIHMTNGANTGTVTDPQVSRSGDDAVAVVSYLSDGVVCHDIAVTRPRVRTTTGGRGVSVVGGTNVTYVDVDIADSSAAGVYIACEDGDFVTASTANVRVLGGRIVGANTDPTIDHGAVLVFSGRPAGSVRDVLVERLAVSDTRATASRQIGVVLGATGDPVSDVVFERMTLARTPPPYEGNAPSAAFSLSRVLAAGHAVRP